MDIQAVIAEAQTSAEAANIEAQAETTALEAEKTVAESTAKEGEDVKEDLSKKTDAELTAEQLAKRERNRQSHLNRQLAKMRRENRDLKELAQKFSQSQAATPTPEQGGAPPPPNEDNYQTWDEFRVAERKYYEDLADWKIEQRLNARDNKAAESTKEQQVNEYKAERLNEHASREVEFAKQVPDYESTVYGDYADFMNNLPLPVAEALLEADNASLALYALAKEGILEQLEDMSPYRVSIEIGKAEVRGEKYLVKDTATSAPPPVEAARGTASPSKSLADMPMDELLSKFRNR
jgi:hypothetical protein